MTSELISRKEKFLFYNNMVCLVKSLENKSTVIDLRNEAFVCGVIFNVDGYMNVEMINAVYSDPRGNKYPFEKFFISARNIRYVHLPKDVNVVQLLKEKFDSLKQPKQVTRKSNTFKEKRAKRYQKEILQELKEKRMQAD